MIKITKQQNIRKSTNKNVCLNTIANHTSDHTNDSDFKLISDIGIQFYENCLKKAIEFKEELDEAKVLTGYGKILTNIKVIQSYNCMVKQILFLFSHNFI